MLRSTIERLGVMAPDWEVRLWRDGDLDWLANRRWFDESPTYAGQVNIARYEILERHGGLYVDADFDFVRSPGMLDLGEHGLALAPERKGFFNNAFMACSPGHPFLRRLVERVGASIDLHPGQPTWIASGPEFLSSEVVAWAAEAGAEWTEIPRDAVYPYSFDKLDRADGPWSDSVVAIHRWEQARSDRAWRPSHAPRTPWSRRVTRPATWLLDLARPRYRLSQIRRWLQRERWRPNGFSVGEGRTFTVLRSGRPIVFDSADTVQLQFLATDGRFDEGFRRFLASTLSGSDVYVDVGANIGQFVVEAMRHLNRYGRVFAFEPNPRIADILRTNVTLHGHWRAEVIVHEVAVSDRVGPAVLHVPRFHSGRGTLWSGTVGDVDRRSIDEVDTGLVRLDDVLGHLSHVRLLKVDVEGNEPHVLAGAAGLIESGRVDFVDLESVRRHLGPRLPALTELLSRWERQDATFWSITDRGRLRRHPRPVAEVLAVSDHDHLLMDTRVFGARARARTARRPSGEA